ncbi:MAG: hypothetical protein HKN67_06620 [Saprospiraceae bacterium]|nr:hypothetical protein [Bacteroidia bacterium]NNF21595.1 hypothetical protein [Saprospiraceae bacterium]
MKSIYNVLFVFMLTIGTTYGQAGLQLYAGTSNAMNRDASITPQGQSHTGYHFGLDARLNEGKMFFGGGLEYSSINFVAKQNKSYFSVDHPMTWFKIRIGLGYKLIDITDKINIRAKTYGSINMITKYPEDMIDVPYTRYNSGTAAGVIGLGMDIHSLTLDFEYERGFFNAVHLVKGTEIDFYKLSLGFRI